MRGIVATMVILVFAGQSAYADIFSSSNRAHLFKSQTKILDTRAAAQYNNSVRLKPAPINTPTKWGSAKDAARRHGVPEDLFLRLVQQESNWNPQAVSHKGALGLAQLMPATAKKLNVDPKDPYQNLDGGARYLKQQYRTFGTWRLALAAYNAGPGAVRRHGGVPPFNETRNYVKVIWGS